MGVLITAVFLWAAVGVGSRPVSSPLNNAKVECIIQETLNEDGSHHDCGPQLAEELDEVQRHQGLLGELQRLADDEREHAKERYEYNLSDDEKTEEKEEDMKEEDDTKKKIMEEPRIEHRGSDTEEERAKELEELLAEEITKKGKEERNDEELKELLKELKKKRYEAELLEIEAELRKVAAELRALRRG
ncbi:Hydrocephalus-inducing protein [Dissostichus eleginoides]|uniref:Hydrocephalus-inducing protein n=1 Tax=Dissostichus eleginoides TaxID=100907 RepID=A0AAD9CEG3_DISEL|nr:Hydrocephalus-inducing protein [Dissostichus eleginoides]